MAKAQPRPKRRSIKGKQAHEALRESEERLHLVVSSAPIVLFAFDCDGICTLSEGKGLEALGLKPGEFVGRSVFDLLAGTSHEQSVRRALAGEASTTVSQFTGRTFETHCVPLQDGGGQVAGAIGVAIDITERAQAEEALRESEAKYRQIFENEQDIYYRTNIQGTITEVSPSVERFGYTREELIGTPVTSVYDTPEERSSLIRQILERGEVSDYEIRMKAADGRLVDGSLSAHLVRDAGGAPIGFEGSIRNISKRQQAEEALHKSEERLRLLASNAPVTLFALDRDGVITLSEGKGLDAVGLKPGEQMGVSIFDRFPNLPNVRERFDRVLAGETATFTVESNGQALEVHCSPGRDPDGKISGIIGVALNVTERKRMEEALRDSEAKYRQIFENVQDIYYRTSIQGLITEISPSVERFGYNREELLGTPVSAIYETPGERSALLRMILTRGEVTDYEIRVKAADGRVIDGSLNAHLVRGSDGAPAGFEGSIRDISRRTRVEEALRDSEEKFRHIFENVQDVYYRTDAQGIFTDMSRSVEQFGYTAEELIGTPATDVYENPEERQALLAALLEHGLVTDFHVHLKMKDGETRTDSVSSHVLRGPNGEFLGVEGSLRDITARKRTEEALRESEERLRAVMTNVPVMLFTVDRDGVFTLSEGKGLEALGLKPGQLVGVPVFDAFPGMEGMAAYIRRALDGEAFTAEVELAGSTFEAHCAPLRDLGGQITGLIGVATDISERKRMEEALRDAEQKFHRIFEKLPEAYYRTDAQGIIIDISSSIERYGFPREELIGKQVLNFYESPEERSTLLEALSESGDVAEREIRLTAADGRVIDTSVCTYALRGPNGEFAGVEGILRDITERKRMEAALRESEEKYRKIFENVQDIYYRTDAQGIFTDISRSVERFGYAAEALIGTPATDVYANPEERQGLLAAILEHGLVTDYEVHLKTKAGETRIDSVSSHVLLGPDGEFAGIEGTLRDITERKRIEEALRESEEKYRKIFENVQDIYYRTDGQGTITEISRSVEHFGYTTEELTGTPVQNLYRNPKERLALVKSLIESGVVTDFEVHLKTKAGEWRTASISAHILRGPDGEFAGSEGSIRDITERKRTEEALKQTAAELESSNAALRETEEKFHRIFDNVQDIYYRTDDKGIITEISPSVRRFGNDPDDLVGTPVLDMYKDPGERSALMKALFEQGVVIDFEVHLRSGDGLDRTTSVSTHLLRGPNGEFLGVEGSLRDVTERKRMEKELRESEAKYRGIFENVQDIYYVTDDKGIITEISPSISRYGYTREMLIGTPVLDVYASPEERSALLQAVLEQGAVGDFEVHLKTGDGRVIPTSVSTHTLRSPDGEFLGVEGSLRDITERKRMEEALREQARRDPLTSALNHGTIVDELRKLIAGDSDGASHAVAMVDVDGLKAINDTYGHQVGDAVLVAVAGGLSRDGAIIGRYGGDEFVALLPNTDREAAESYRQRVLDALAEVDLRDSETGTRVQIIASVGLAIYPTEAGRIEELIKLADSAMYAWRRQRPVLSAGSTLSRSEGGDRAAKMVGQIVPLLTSLDDLDDKLRLVAHRLSVGGDYDAVNFVLFGSEGNPQGGLTTFARMPEELVDAWSSAQRQASHSPIRRVQERTRRAIIMDDPQNDERFTADQRELLRAAGMRSVLIAPMIWRDELIGHLSVASKREGAFGPRDAEFLVAVATQVTAITRLATLVEDLRTTSTRLEQGHTETVVLLAAAAEAHDHHTGLHLRSVRSITEALALELGYSEEYAEELGLAAVLHDIGKIRVPDVVLATAGQLTDEEWDLMKQHTVWGEDFLSERPGFELAAVIARSHHERWDGSGYPDRLVGKSIPTAATIVSVADAFDAMVNDRPYRSARSVASAVREIVSCSGAQFSPKVVQALARLHRQTKLVRLHREALIDLAA